MIELAVRDAWSVLLASLAFGAGVPIIYAIAMRARVAWATVTIDADGEEHVRPRLFGNLVTGLLLLVTVGIVALGITMIAASGFGKTVAFEYLIIPVIVDS